MTETRELAEKIAEEMEEQQEKFDNCRHDTIEHIEEDKHWECKSCGLHFEPKQLGSSRLPDIQESGDLRNITVKEYHPDWIRRSAVLKRMKQIWSQEGSETDMWYKLENELYNLDSRKDLLEEEDN